MRCMCYTLQAGLAMNRIFEVLGENKKYIDIVCNPTTEIPVGKADPIIMHSIRCIHVLQLY
jgi:hypothetical protein